MHQKNTRNIGLDQPIPVRRLSRSHVSWKINSCVCEEDVQPTKVFDRSLGNTIDILWLGHVGGNNQCLAGMVLRQTAQLVGGTRR